MRTRGGRILSLLGVGGLLDLHLPQFVPIQVPYRISWEPPQICRTKGCSDVQRARFSQLSQVIVRIPLHM